MAKGRIFLKQHVRLTTRNKPVVGKPQTGIIRLNLKADGFNRACFDIEILMKKERETHGKGQFKKRRRD